MMLKGLFIGKEFDDRGTPAAQIHPSSIDHLPVTRGITKAIAMPNSCVLSGPNGNLRFWCFREHRRNFNAEFFTSFPPISVLEIKELWVGQAIQSDNRPWRQTVAGVRGAFGVLTKVEELTIVDCEMTPISSVLGAADADIGILLPALRRLTIYAGSGNLDVAALVQCARVRKEHLRPFSEVTIVWEEVAEIQPIPWVESLRESVVEVNHRVGVAPKLVWTGTESNSW